MTTAVAAAETAPTTNNYLTAKSGIWSWVTTTDHKRIALLYLWSMLIFFVFAALLAFMFRLELFEPGMQYITSDIYNRLITLHGISMIFLFIIPGIPAVFGNFFLPILIGAEDVSFPRINLLSYYCFVVGALLALFSVLFGGVDTGWTFYVPYSLRTEQNIFWPMMAAFILGWSSILTGLNFVTTVHRLRDKRMKWFKMPLFIWALYSTGWVQIMATPVVGITLVMVLLEKFVGVAIFDPSRGGDPILYEHLFWIYSHPAVYIMILPAMGIVSEIIATFSRKTIFGYKFVAYSSIAIAGIGSLVWAHHMFTSGMSDAARVIFSFLTFFVAVPSAIKVFNWLATMYRGSIKLDPPMVWALMFILLFSIGGLTGLYNGMLSIDIHVHDTSFIVAHFHYTMFGGTIVIFYAALLYWWPKMFGRMYNKKLTSALGAMFFVGFNLTYFPLFMAGMAGMPRRYADYLPRYEIYHKLSTVGSWILIASLLILLIHLIWACRRGKKAEGSPWGGATLEWTTPTPPPTLNFDGEVDLSRWAYEYPEEVER